MAKHRDRREEKRQEGNTPDANQLMQLLGNVDLNQLSSLLGSMNNDGHNINSGSNGEKSNRRGEGRGDKDSTLQMLRSLRGYVSPSKVRIIDRIIEMYQSGEFDD